MLSDRCTQNTESSVTLINEKLTFSRYNRVGGRASRAARFFGAKIQKLRLRATNCGAILIEFAICMPVLIILLFYIHDLVKIKRYYSQTEFVAQQMANIFQNISQKREGAKRKINKNDIRHAASLAHLTIYPGKTMYADGKRGGFSHELSHMPFFFIYYVEGLSGGRASVIWSYVSYCYNAVNPAGWLVDLDNSNYGVVRKKTDVSPTDIYPTLKINEGEVKIIIECPLFCRERTMSLDAYVASDSQDTRAKKAFNCRLVTPKATYKTSQYGFYFNSVVIFTPKPGLFDRTPPADS